MERRLEQRLPAAHGKAHGDTGCFPAAQEGPRQIRFSPCSPCQSKLLARAMACGKEPKQEQVSCKYCNLWVIQAGAVMNGCILWKGPMLKVEAEKEYQEEGPAKYPLVPLWDRRDRSEAGVF